MRTAVISGPIERGEFDRLMAPLGPFGAARRVVVGVSGGADSMALAWLLRLWGQPLAVVVDHGLRPESAAEAALAVQRLAAKGVPARCETLVGLGHGANLGSRAREARYAALLRVCKSEGVPDLLVAHHAQDQAETVMLRRARGSGATGLAAMPAVGWRADARILRPLLSVMPDRLRSTLSRAGMDWVDDPGNRDLRTARGALRSGMIDVEQGSRVALRAGEARAAEEKVQAAELGRSVTVYGTGHCFVSAPISDRGWSELIWTASGRAYPPALEAVHRIGAAGTGTLHGIQLRHGVVMREMALDIVSVAATAGLTWDSRFFVRRTVPNAQVLAWGERAAGLRRSRTVSFSVRKMLPVLQVGTNLFTNPDLVYRGGVACTRFQVEFRPIRPLAGAPFVPARSGRAGPGDADGDWAPHLV